MIIQNNIMRNIFMLLFGSIAMISCQNATVKNGSNTISDIKTPKNNGKKIATSCDSTIVSTEFKYEALAFNVFEADTNKIKALFLDKAVLKIVQQKNSEGGTFDEYHFTDGVNSFMLHYNRGFYMEDADIKNDRVLLNKKLSFGMDKSAFLKIVKLKDIGCDTITTTNDEYSFANVFIFKDGKLHEIRMGQTVE